MQTVSSLLNKIAFGQYFTNTGLSLPAAAGCHHTLNLGSQPEYEDDDLEFEP